MSTSNLTDAASALCDEHSSATEHLESNEALSSTIITFETNLKKTARVKLTRGFLKSRSELIERYWSKFYATHSLIVTHATVDERTNDKYFTNELYSITEESYLNCCTYLNDKQFEMFPTTVVSLPSTANGQVSGILSESVPMFSQVPSATAVHTQLKLKPPTIPKFDGKYQNWPSFYDIFTSLVHDDATMPAVHKLHHLKGSLTGEAELLIRHFQLTAANYTPAWEMLNQRYANKRVLLDAQLRVLFNQPRTVRDDADSIKTLLDTTMECLYSIQNLGIATVDWDPIMIYLITQRLSPGSLQLWEQGLTGCDSLPKYRDLTDFLERRYRTLEAIANVHCDTIGTPSKRSPRNDKQTFHATVTPISCIKCSDTHSIRQCEQFKAMSVNDRSSFAKSKRLCVNCLSASHNSNKCASNKRCFECKGRHHTLLHLPITKPSTNNNATPPDVVTPSPTDSPRASTSQASLNTFHLKENCSMQQVLLATAIVRLRSEHGQEVVVRALLDQGSQATFITEDIAQKLNVRKVPIVASINGIGQSGTTHIKHQAYVTMNAHFQDGLNLQMNALILKSLNSILPTANIQGANWSHIEDLVLADPNYTSPASIDVLIGSDNYGIIIMEGLRRGKIGSPIAQKTKLGWVLSGQTSAGAPVPSQISVNVVNTIYRSSLDEQLRKFWEIEEISSDRTMTHDEIYCEEHYRTTHKRDETGRFIVRLPFLQTFSQDIKLGQSRQMAVRRLNQLEHRFRKMPSSKSEYVDCIDGYINLNHVEDISDVEQGTIGDHCYLGHHAVIKETSTSTRVRVVFDASQKTTSGYSLNDCLHIGPRLQDDLYTIALRWRKHKIAMTADVEKMYRQILVAKEDADFQRIVWRPNPEQPIKDYRLLTVTFGTSCAPYVAIKTLRQLAIHEEQRHPIATEALLNDFYVDDLLSGSDSITAAIDKQNQIRTVLRKGGFELKKWTSNCPQVLENVPPDHRETSLPFDLDQDKSVKTLGIFWHPVTDVFKLKICLEPLSDRLTKRVILSDIAKVFDPIGLVSPVTIKAKIFMQSLWLSGADWDDQLPKELTSEWTAYRAQLHLLEQLQIPRWIGTDSDTRSIQSHCFSDASIRAYAAAVYIRIVDRLGRISTNLVSSKTKVAPLKVISLPRLELNGALLAAKLSKNVQVSMKFNDDHNFAWTDSTIVLAWLRGHPTRWKTFVANRVVQIHGHVDVEAWRHVSSEDNPADIPSRGINPSELRYNKLWWHGPEWLSLPEGQWPTNKTLVDIETKLECRHIAVATTVSMQLGTLLNDCSTYRRLIRRTAYCLRFIDNIRPARPKFLSPVLTVFELRRALTFWVKHSQLTAFDTEMKWLLGSNNDRKNLPSTCKIVNLNPFVDAEGVLRVGGRLAKTELPFDEKHPVILSKQCRLTRLIIDDSHLRTLHGGAQVTLNAVRRRFWVLDARNTVRHQIFKCIQCFKQRGDIQTQLMGQLPAVRVTQAHPFEHTGVDYAGPLDIKLNRGRTAKTYKGYIALFVCMCTRAIHLEVVSELSTAGFLAAFRRFSARRGLCSAMYSDCGTNFVGAARVLKEDFERNKVDRELAEMLANDGTSWHFIPPGAPHFGGLWEAGVKATKHHLRRTLGNSVLTYEELITVVNQIEAVLNSRPLCPLTTDPNDLDVLTPGHFLVGRPLIAVPEQSLLDINTNRLDRWKRGQQIVQLFWKRWHTEHLSRLQQRPKWLTTQRNVKPGDMVLVKEDRLPPSKWLLGRITDIIKGSDDLVRVAMVKTKTGLIKRAIAKLSVLPLPIIGEGQPE